MRGGTHFGPGEEEKKKCSVLASPRLIRLKEGCSSAFFFSATSLKLSRSIEMSGYRETKGAQPNSRRL